MKKAQSSFSALSLSAFLCLPEKKETFLSLSAEDTSSGRSTDEADVDKEEEERKEADDEKGQEDEDEEKSEGQSSCLSICWRIESA